MYRNCTTPYFIDNLQAKTTLDRRKIIKLALLSTALVPLESIARPLQITATRKKIYHRLPARTENIPKEPHHFDDTHIKDYLTKIRHPNRPHSADITLSAEEFKILESVVKRFIRVRATVGHGKFCIIGHDRALQIARNYSSVGSFTQAELNFLEKIFYRDANDYGFMGKKQINNLTQIIRKKDVYKVPYTGNYLFKGDSLHKYEKVKKQIGEELVLTSGIRGVTKQFFLFLNKAYRYQGNLSLASRSLAPPGYSYHATGDFDVGQKGFGGGNFSTQFTSTPVYHQLTDQGYVKYRYTKDNMLGVRYEPWHIKL